eukprot:gnl/Chilomastix_caulleri/7567.p2 GENE.gnl/Chilomastix_caulleri/7567~~gnl/Chilomastix_caulleri/7567.p2  ORF type:complete len:53 (+),score=16.01 gnl/Chilomastix_caulleri/7567:109-267(+)
MNKKSDFPHIAVLVADNLAPNASIADQEEDQDGLAIVCEVRLPPLLNVKCCG